MKPQLHALVTPSRVDLLIAGGLFVWAAPDVPWWWKPPGHVPTTPVVLGYLALALAMSVPFLWRRRFPATVLVIVATVLATRLALHQNAVSAFAAVLVAAYGLGAYSIAGRRYARWLGWLALRCRRRRRHRSARRQPPVCRPSRAARRRVPRRRRRDARRNETASAIDAAHLIERTRIARELHDVLAHQLSAIAIQAGAARIAYQTSPALSSAAPTPSGAGAAAAPRPANATLSPVEALATIEDLAREAIVELGHLLGMLRHDVEDGPARRPAPTLAELDTLLAAARTAGVPADLAIIGPVRNLTPGLEVSVYRIVQESLTNVTKHAPGAPTRVSLQYRDDHLDLSIVNAPSPLVASNRYDDGGRHSVGGRGLRGIRERAELYDGSFDASTKPGGGFAVRAKLPYGRAGEANWRRRRAFVPSRSPW